MQPTKNAPYEDGPSHPTKLNPELNLLQNNELLLKTHDKSKQGKASVNVNVNMSEGHTSNSDAHPKIPGDPMNQPNSYTLFTPSGPDNADTKSNKGNIRITSKSPNPQRAPRGKSDPRI